MKKIAFYTLGCRANQYQTEVMKSDVQSPRSQPVDFSSYADVYVINTCAVTLDADRKSRQAIRRALRQNPKAKVIVTGCYARLEKDELKKTFPGITLNEPPSPFYPERSRGTGRGGISFPAGGVRVRSNLMIQDGCEHFCSYCIVPHVRGKIKSKPLKQVIEEAKSLVAAGAREIVLTGINLGTYEFDLTKVIKHLPRIDNLSRLRLSSLEPMYITRELIDAAAQNPKVCKHLHLPLQSGDDSILSKMNREYTRSDFMGIVDYIRKKMPDCGVTTDIIVGFPGEGTKEFQNTVDLVNKIKFSRLHVFSYSKRKGTPAANFPDQVDPETKKQRNKVLHQLRDKYMKEFAQQYLNQEVEILVEQPGEGLTSNFIRCFFPDPSDSSGSLRKIFARLVTNPGEIRA